MVKQIYWRGVPVPYIAMWSSETERYVAPDRYSGDREALFSHGRRGEGVPVWGKMHEARQRETCATQRCQVCNCKLVDERGFGVDVAQMMNHSGKVYQVLTEPPACARCMRYSLDNCPGIRRRFADGSVRCFEVFAYAAIGQIIGAVEGGDSDLNALLKPGQQVIGYHKCLLTRAEQLTEQELRERVKL
jgi:hypothetical protein